MNLIPRVECPARSEFVARFVRTNRPAVITGDTSHARAVSEWSPAHLAERCGDEPIPVMQFPERLYRPDIGTGRSIVMMTMGEYFERVSQPPPHLYLGNIPLDQFPRLTAEVTPPPYFGRAPSIKLLFISRGGSITPLHFDAGENLLVQVSGRKRFVLFPPGTRNLYPFPFFSKQAHMSQVVLEEPDPARFPRYDPEQRWETTLEPGEIIYIPHCWWHQVHPVTDLSMSAAYFWFSGVRKMLSTPGPSLRRAKMLMGDVEHRIGRQAYRPRDAGR